MTAVKTHLCLAVTIMSLQEQLSSVGAMPNYDVYGSRSDSASWYDHYAIDDIIVQPDMELIIGRSDDADLLSAASLTSDLLEQQQPATLIVVNETEHREKHADTIPPGLLMLSIAALCMVLVLIIGTIGYKRLANRDLKQSISESSLQQTTTCSNSTEECEIKIDSILDLEKSCLSYREVETEITQISEVTVPINWDD